MGNKISRGKAFFMPERERMTDKEYFLKMRCGICGVEKDVLCYCPSEGGGLYDAPIDLDDGFCDTCIEPGFEHIPGAFNKMEFV